MRGRLSLGLIWVLAACGDDAGDKQLDLLQNDCVLEQLELERTLEDGETCSNFGYSDCPRHSSGSECVHYCAFDLCQEAPCRRDDECADLGETLECTEYVVSDYSYGKWCGTSDCPKGTQGCPCRDDGACYSGNFLEAFCNDDNICAGDYTCEPYCIVGDGAVCCGGTYCSGDCIGTPCC